jgi:cytochrome P450
VGAFRKVTQSFTFSNGITVTPGDTVAAPAGPIHFDDSVYNDALTFNAFRFSEMRETEGDSAKVHSVNTGVEFLTFGHGEHAW